MEGKEEIAKMAKRIKIEEQRDKLKERKKKNGKKEGSGIDWARVLFQWRSAMFLR